jgi:hypothetical protein
MPEGVTDDKSLWKAAEAAVTEADVSKLEQLLRENPRLLKMAAPSYVPQGPGPDYHADAARSILVREHFFQDFEELQKHFEILKSTPEHPVAQFEAAVEAIIHGDIPTLQRLLRARPELIRARSPRTHRSTLLHYVGANGVEGWRQKTPQNAVAVTELLLNAGADINSAADMYGGGSTTLGLVATSIHPWTAGVVEPLMDTLLKRGAKMGGPELVNGCLANGRPWAAEYLAARGAPLDLEGAAGVGRLDLVRTYFDESGALKQNATEAQMHSGFAWACEYGRTEVAKFLLDNGMPIDAKIRNHGQTGLHWAAHGAHLSLVKLLLERGAPVNIKDPAFDGTPLGWALHGWSNGVPQTSPERYYEVVSLLVRAGATVEQEWLAGEMGEKLRADARMRKALERI